MVITSLYGLGSNSSGFDLRVSISELGQLPEVLGSAPAELGYSADVGLLDEIVILGLDEDRGTIWQLSLRLGAELCWDWLL